MNEELRELLQTDYQYAVEAQIADEAEAEATRKAGEMATYFDLALHLQLADACWALEKWGEAKHWYRHNARVLNERRVWRAEHGGPDMQTEGLSDWEASTLIKAGELDAGREYVQRAIQIWRLRPGSELTLTELGLHAAQAGVPELVPYVRSVIDAREELPGGDSQPSRQARQLLHYEPAQAYLLLGRWDEFLKELKALQEGEQLAQSSSEFVFPEPLQQALVAVVRGLSTFAALRSSGIPSIIGQDTVKQAFEEAMLHFYRFSGQIDWNLYFMRLNTQLTDDLAAGRPPNPNPFRLE